MADSKDNSALSHISSDPTLVSGLVDNLISNSLKPKSEYIPEKIQ